MMLSIILINSAMNLGLWLNEMYSLWKFRVLFYRDKTPESLQT